MNFVVIAIYLILTCLGLILFKLGAASGYKISFTNGLLNIKVNYLAILGLLSYIGSFMVYLGLVSKMKLSYLVPFTTGVVQVIILIASAVIFKETISTSNIIGIALVILGIILMNI